MKKLIISATVAAAVFSTSALSQDREAEAKSESPAAFKERLKQTFISSVNAIKSNMGDAEQAAMNAHIAFRAAFQAGEFGQAEKMLSLAVSKGYTLTAADNAAMSEIEARRGNFKLAAEYLEAGMKWFKQSHCKTDPGWKAFHKKLKSEDAEKLGKELAENVPALINPYPQRDVHFWREYIGYNGANPQFPDVLHITVTVRPDGRIACSSMDDPKPRYKRMLVVTKGHTFEPATVNGNAVWRFDYAYEIRQEQIYISDMAGN